MRKKTKMKVYLYYFSIDETRRFAKKAVREVQTIRVQLFQYGVGGLMEGIRIQEVSGRHRPTHVMMLCRKDDNLIKLRHISEEVVNSGSLGGSPTMFTLRYRLVIESLWKRKEYTMNIHPIVTWQGGRQQTEWVYKVFDMEADMEVVTTQAKLVRRKPGLAIIIKRLLNNGNRILTSTTPVNRAFILPHRVDGASSIFCGNQVLRLMAWKIVLNNILSSSISAPLRPIHDPYTLHVRREPEIKEPERPVP